MFLLYKKKNSISKHTKSPYKQHYTLENEHSKPKNAPKQTLKYLKTNKNIKIK